MAHSFTNLLYHIVFATDRRQPVLIDDIRPELFAFLATTIRDEGGITLAVNGIADHVHLLVKLRADTSISDVLRNVKARSSAWIHRRCPDLAQFSWQTGYGAFTVSQSQVPVVRRYIEQQEEHHRNNSFDNEFRAMLRKNEFDVNEEFFWE